MTTEDTETGTRQNPLTRNRYAYVTNNPVNYQDPSGHFLKKLWNGVKKAAKKVVKTVKNVAKKVVNTVKKAAKWVVNAVTNTKKTIEKAVDNVKKTAKKTYQKAVSAGSRFVQSVGNGIKSAGRKLTKTYTSFKSYVAERTAEIKETVVRELCTTANRITDALGKVDWKKVGITAALVVSAGAVALTGGLAAGAVLGALPALGGLGTAVVTGAVTGAIGGAAFSGTSSLLSGNSAGDVLKDTLLGGLTGGFTGGAMGGLGYGASKLVNGVKTAINGGSSGATQPGHITEMAKKDLSGTGGSKSSDPYKLLEERGINPTLSSEERAAADAYGMVAKASKNSNTTAGQVYANKGYNPVPGERTIEGYVKNNANPEVSLQTNSPNFNNNSNGVGGTFKRIGAESHAGVSPHVHNPQRNVAPNGDIYGSVGTKTGNGGVTSPTEKDVKQLYEYLENSKYQ